MHARGKPGRLGRSGDWSWHSLVSNPPHVRRVSCSPVGLAGACSAGEGPNDSPLDARQLVQLLSTASSWFPELPRADQLTHSVAEHFSANSNSTTSRSWGKAKKKIEITTEKTAQKKKRRKKKEKKKGKKREGGDGKKPKPQSRSGSVSQSKIAFEMTKMQPVSTAPTGLKTSPGILPSFPDFLKRVG